MASRTDPSYEHHRALLYQHKIRYQKVLESPFSTLSMAMIPELNALSINNVLIAELVCQHNERLTWRMLMNLIIKLIFIYQCHHGYMNLLPKIYFWSVSESL